MIISFKDKEAEKIFNLKPSRKLPQNIQVRAHRKLLMVNSAGRIEDLRNPPSNHLEKLKGDRKDEWRIKINDQWRVCFKYDEIKGDAYDVLIEDYH